MICQPQKEMLEFVSNLHNGYFVVATSLKTDVFTGPAAAAPLLDTHVCAPAQRRPSPVSSRPSLPKQTRQTGDGKLRSGGREPGRQLPTENKV